VSQTTVLPLPDLSAQETTTSSFPRYWLYVLFFFSGFPALIYQIVWQRALFMIYGVNIESVTVVVTAFMLGLGLGSLVGGRVSRWHWPMVPVFAAVELCTSVYGILSLHLFHGAAQITAGASTLLTGVCAFALVLVPTILMGSTLPILLGYLIKVLPNMGRATGLLYFVNTLGSSTACFVAGLFTMRLLGMSGSVRLAAAINALVGVCALAAWIATRRRSAAVELCIVDSDEAVPAGRVLPFSAGVALAAISGFIALGYEIVWYRLFSWASGTNPKTFACLLGSYLAGLAVGALAVQRCCSLVRAATDHLRFTGTTLVIGNMVAVGVPLMLSVAPGNHAQTIGMVWVACATALLGTTFPMVCHLTVRPDRSAGEGLSFLYLSNIVGSAAGSFVTGYVLTEVLPLSAINGLLAMAGVFLGFVLMRRSDVQSRIAEATPAVRLLSPSVGIALAAFSGFITLGYGMWWGLLILSKVDGANWKVFAFMGSCLAGLALGAIGVERRYRSVLSAANHLWFSGITLVGGNVMAVLIPPILSVTSKDHAQLIAMLWVVCAATLLGTTFPTVRRLAVRPDRSTEDCSAGRAQSSLNFSYIAGAVAGSVVVGYVLAQMFSLFAIGAWLATAGIVAGFSFMLRSGLNTRHHAFVNVLAVISVLAILVFSSLRIYEPLCSWENSCTGAPFTRVVENRNGVIAVGNDNRTVIGGGAYDGRFNVDPVHDANGIRRCYNLFGFLSRSPKHVLMIGLSSGSWAQVVANHPEVESLTIVEINPGYLKIIPEHAEVASLLRNPKVRIFIDDGHRWLLRNPGAKFDLVVMNSTFYWRANTTNLLSREFLELLRRHIEPGGAHFYNTTGSPDAQFTAVSVFPYAVRIANFIAVSDAPLRFHPDRWHEIMKAYRIDDAPVLDLSRPDDHIFVDTVVNDAQLASNAPNSTGNQIAYFELEASLRWRLSRRTVVTDDNMAVEWRRPYT
jgi:spermidine synthase